MKKQNQIEHIATTLKLQKHLEGGYFRQTYRGPVLHGDKSTMTIIYFLITQTSPLTNWVMDKSDIVTTHIRGGKIRYFFIYPQTGQIQQHVISSHIQKGQVPQLLIPRNIWSCFLLEQGQYALTTEAVAPGFQYKDMTFSNVNQLIQKFPNHKQFIENIETHRKKFNM